jgi:hypothetical protein
MRFKLSTSTCIGFAAGLALGASLGQLDDLGVRDAQASPGKSPAFVPKEVDPSSQNVDLESALMDTWSSNLRLAARVNSLEALIEAMGSNDVSRTVESSISQMSDRDLESVLASMIHLSREEIEEVGDLRAFANRLADIAMEDTLMPTDATAGGEHVVFTTSPDRDGTRSQFDAGETRIYAVFPTDYFDQEKVMVKWYRRDHPEILLLQRYPIVAGDQYVGTRPVQGGHLLGRRGDGASRVRELQRPVVPHAKRELPAAGAHLTRPARSGQATKE